jgi:LmbE family N-acetylglucosaminyl deacetylase
MNLNFKSALVLAPHTDDAEFGCGGTIAKLLENNVDVHIATFSSCEKSTPGDFPPDILKTEFKEASSILGVPQENLYLLDYEVRIFNEKRQDILQDLIDLRSKLKPDLILMPSLDDIHQDHNTIAQEGLRAFKFTTILTYEMPWNNLTFNTSSFVLLEEKHIQKKIDALSAYKSQAHRPYASDEFIRGLARTRGTQINAQYAETFNVLRWIIK